MKNKYINIVKKFISPKRTQLVILVMTIVLANSIFIVWYFPENFKQASLQRAESETLNISKLTLNLIRQNNGYKDGSYKKVIDGKEDNELLHDVIDGITMEELEKDFDSVANTIMSDTYKVFGMENSEDKFTIETLRELVS